MIVSRGHDLQLHVGRQRIRGLDEFNSSDYLAGVIIEGKAIGLPASWPGSLAYVCNSGNRVSRTFVDADGGSKVAVGPRMVTLQYVFRPVRHAAARRANFTNEMQAPEPDQDSQGEVPAGPRVESWSFTDAQAHAESLRPWRQNYDQISAGAFRSSLLRLSTNGITVFREQANQRISEQGVAPDGPRLSFGLLLDARAPAWFQGRTIGASDLLCLPGATEFRLHLPPGADLVGVTLPEQLLRWAMPGEASQSLRRLLDRHLISLQPARHERLRSGLGQLVSDLVAASCAWAPAMHKLAAHRVAEMLVWPLLDGVSEPRFDLTQAVRCGIVDRSRELAMRQSDEPVTVLDLCVALKVSRRTLQNSFLSVTGTSPASYLRSVRLAQVRRDLQRTSPQALSIREAAARWGFSGIHFAADYRRQFGELPSMTRRKT